MIAHSVASYYWSLSIARNHVQRNNEGRIKKTTLACCELSLLRQKTMQVRQRYFYTICRILNMLSGVLFNCSEVFCIVDMVVLPWISIITSKNSRTAVMNRTAREFLKTELHFALLTNFSAQLNSN